MTQRVNIQYTIDIDDLEKEIVRLMRVLEDNIDIGLRDVNAIINGYVAHQTQMRAKQPTATPDALAPQMQENLSLLQEQLKNIRNLPTNEDPS